MKLPGRKSDKTHPAYRRAKAQEKETASRLGGKQTLASGSKAEKGDVRVSGVLRLECKCTSRKSYSLKREDLRKIANAATGGEVPALEIEFLGEDGKVEMAVAVVPRYVLEQLCQS